MLQRFLRRRFRSWVLRAAPLLPLCAATAACSNNNDALSAVVADVAATSTDTFSGTLVLNSAKTFPFVVSNPGDVTAVLSVLSPDSAQIVGLSLGTWNASNFSCQVVLTNDQAVQSSSVTGHATAASTFCVRVFDASGNLPQPETYTVTVTHP